MRPKITIVGAGNVGSTAASLILQRNYADIILLDVVEDLARGKALDLQQSVPLLGSAARIKGTGDYKDTAGSAIAVITAGVARKPGMSRDDLLLTNRDIVKGVVENLVWRSPGVVLVVVTNPLDAMAQLALKVSGIARERVLGMSGLLDSARFQTFVALELGVAPEVVHPFVLGGHGDTMVPLPRLTTVGGVPLTQLMRPEAIARIVQRTINGGAEIVALLKAGSAYYAPGAAIARMVDAIALDEGQVMPCSVYLEGEYGISGVFVGVPAILGAGGLERVVEVALEPAEQEALNRSAAAVRELAAAMEPEGD
jgi:malate dehydrogenase